MSQAVYELSGFEKLQKQFEKVYMLNKKGLKSSKSDTSRIHPDAS